MYFYFAGSREFNFTEDSPTDCDFRLEKGNRGSQESSGGFRQGSRVNALEFCMEIKERFTKKMYMNGLQSI